MLAALLLASLATSPAPLVGTTDLMPPERITLTPTERTELELREQYLERNRPSMRGPGTVLGLSLGAGLGAVTSALAGLIVNDDWSWLYSNGFDARRHVEPWIATGIFTLIAAVAIPLAARYIHQVMDARNANQRELEQLQSKLQSAAPWP